MRKVKVYSTVGTSGTIETNVRTLGELKPLLAAQGISYDGMKMLVGETRNELGVDEAVLPETDFKLYLMPEKTKSGTANYDEILYALDRAAIAIDEAREAIYEAQENQSYAAKAPVKSTSYEDEAAFEDLARLSGQVTKRTNSSWD